MSGATAADGRAGGRLLSPSCLAGPAWTAADAGRDCARAIAAAAEMLVEGGWSEAQVRHFVNGCLARAFSESPVEDRPPPPIAEDSGDEPEPDCTCHYGYFLGGDPRLFTPDDEANTVEEIERHRLDSLRWAAGERDGFPRGGCREGAAGYGMGSAYCAEHDR